MGSSSLTSDGTQPPASRVKSLSHWNSREVPILLVLSRARLFVTPLDCSPPGSSVHGISQARILEWVAPNWMLKATLTGISSTAHCKVDPLGSPNLHVNGLDNQGAEKAGKKGGLCLSTGRKVLFLFVCFAAVPGLPTWCYLVHWYLNWSHLVSDFYPKPLGDGTCLGIAFILRFYTGMGPTQTQIISSEKIAQELKWG